MSGDGYPPAHDGPSAYIHVDAIDPALDASNKHDGEILMPRMSIGEYGFIVHFEDTEGN
jgi:predicted enzyme related to lactoylglutathione lyase